MLTRTLQDAAQQPPLDLLSVGPHPDDNELTAAGTLLRASDAGYRTGCLELTQGEMGTRGTVEARAAEMNRAADLLGLAFRGNLGLADGSVTVTPESREALVRAIRATRPRVLLIPPQEDDDHPDHWHASRLCWEAVHLASKPRYLPELPAHHVQQTLFSIYKLPLAPNIAVDVSAVMERAEAVARVYASQLGLDGTTDAPRTFISRPEFLDWWRARRAQLGAQIGVAYAEGFRLKGPLRIDDPIAFFAPADRQKPIGTR